MSEWKPIETAPRDVWLIGLRSLKSAGIPAFVGKVWNVDPHCLVDPRTGTFVQCSHVMPLPSPPSGDE